MSEQGTGWRTSGGPVEGQGKKRVTEILSGFHHDTPGYARGRQDQPGSGTGVEPGHGGLVG